MYLICPPDREPEQDYQQAGQTQVLATAQAVGQRLALQAPAQQRQGCQATEHEAADVAEL